MFNQEEKAVMMTLCSRLTALKKAHPESLLITINELSKNLPVKQIKLIDKIITINPADYGINLPYYGLADFVPANLVRLDYWSGRFLPMPVFLQYYCLNQAIVRDLGRQIIFRDGDGYRSDVEQLRVFIGRLMKKDWDVEETLREVCLPGYSQHSFPRVNGGHLQAIDFASSDSNKFAETVHYQWLKLFAHIFGFFNPFGDNNEYNIGPEKWHWVCEFKNGGWRARLGINRGR